MKSGRSFSFAGGYGDITVYDACVEVSLAVEFCLESVSVWAV